MSDLITILNGDCRAELKALPAESVHCVVTSPPYFGLRDYQVDGQIGLEETPEQYIETMVDVFREVWRVLRNDGTVWLNLGDSYMANRGNTANKPGYDNKAAKGGAEFNYVGRKNFKGLKDKDLMMMPHRTAIALQQDGWYVRMDNVWSKPNPMPESVTDRPTRSHEYVFLLSKSARYFYDGDAIKEPFTDERMGNPGKYRKTSSSERKANNDRQDLGFINSGGGWNSNGAKTGRNKRSVWTIATQPYSAPKSISFSQCDYVGDDGKPYKASTDCPIHGHLARSQRFDTPEYDEQLNQIELSNLDTYDHPDQEPSSASVAKTSRILQGERDENAQKRKTENIDESKNEDSRRDNILVAQTEHRTSRSLQVNDGADRKKDLICRDSSETAKQRSKQSRKTARAGRTVERDTASAQTPLSIHHTEELPSLSDSAVHTNGNSISERDSGDSQSFQTAAGISDTFRDRESYVASVKSPEQLYCNCEIVSIDHFATFPPALIEPCILAGTSARGCCIECGAPYERVLEPSPEYAKLLGKDWSDPEQDQNEGRGHFLLPTGEKAAQRPVKRNAPSVTAEYVTVGWKASCNCFYGPAFGDVEPCTVLDPFGGSGTTGKVAIELSRKTILIELNEKYIPLIEKRCATQIGLGL